jgi:hypothetical protein
VCSDAAQLENRRNSMDLVTKFDVRDYSIVHGLMKCIIALIVWELSRKTEECGRL